MQTSMFPAQKLAAVPTPELDTPLLSRTGNSRYLLFEDAEHRHADAVAEAAAGAGGSLTTLA